MRLDVISDLAKVHIKNLKWYLLDKKKAEVLLEKIDNNAEKTTVCRKEFVGLFSYVETTLRQTVQVIDDGKLPFVDMTGCKNPFLLPEETDKNWWELYFEQPVYGKKELAMVKAGNSSGEIPHSRTGVLEKRSRWYWGKVYEAYFRPNSTVMHYFEKEYEALFDSGRLKVLGVLMRGTDYKGAKGHPIQPSAEQVLSAVKRVAHKYDKIYIATEEQKNVSLFEDSFPGKILTNKRNYFDGIDMSDKTINDISFERENDGYLRGLEYLSSILLLSKCDGLVAGICGGSVAAVYMNNNKYNYLKLFYNGINK